MFKWAIILLLLIPGVHAQEDNDNSFVTILPDSPLWRLDILMEDVYIAIVNDKHKKAQLRITYASERLEEISRLGVLNDDAEKRMDNLLFQANNDLKEIGSCVSGREVAGADVMIKINQQCETKYRNVLEVMNAHVLKQEEVRLKLVNKANIYNDESLKDDINIHFVNRKQQNDELMSKFQEKIAEVRREKINKGVTDLDDVWERPDISGCNVFNGIPFITTWQNDKGLKLQARNSCEARKYSEMGWKLKIDKK